jgi:hypothetical protein
VEQPEPAKAPRPDWRLPRPLALVFAALLFVLALLDPLLPELGDVPFGVRLALIVVPVAAAGWWYIRVGRGAIAAMKQRIDDYDRVFDLYQRQRALTHEAEQHAERASDHAGELRRALASIGEAAATDRSLLFRMDSPRWQDGVLLITVRSFDARRRVPLEIGAMLLIRDPADQAWNGGMLEVVAHGNTGREMVARVVAWDPAWLGYVRTVAETREVFQSRTVAI